VAAPTASGLTGTARRDEDRGPVRIVDDGHPCAEARPERRAPAAVARRHELGVLVVDRLIAVDEELEDHPPIARRRDEIGDRPDELVRDHELVARAERDLDVGQGIRVGRELDAQPAVERQRSGQVVHEQHDHREPWSTHASG
jgi:hypothetical protein